MMRACWERDPARRPSFTKIVQHLQELRQLASGNFNFLDSPRPPYHALIDEPNSPSPDIHPIPLPPLPREYTTDAYRRCD